MRTGRRQYLKRSSLRSNYKNYKKFMDYWSELTGILYGEWNYTKWKNTLNN